MSTVLAPAPEHSRSSAAPAPRPSPRPGPRVSPRPDPRPEPRTRPRTDPARRRAPAERHEHLRVVRPEERTTRRLTPKAGVLLTGVVFATLFAVTGAHTIIAQGQIRLDRLDQRVRTEQARYQELRKDVAQMASPQRIVAAAEAQGMVSPQDLVYLQPDAAAAAASGTSTDDTASASAAPPSTGSWDTVKPLLEAPAP